MRRTASTGFTASAADSAVSSTGPTSRRRAAGLTRVWRRSRSGVVSRAAGAPGPEPVGYERLTVGVEEEFLVVDARTGEVLDRAPEVLRAAAHLGEGVQAELTRFQVEVATPVCHDMDELYKQLLALRSGMAAAAAEHGCRVVATGTPVLGRVVPPPITEKPRYLRMAQMFGALVDGQSVCGCHVHVGIPDLATALQVSNHLRPWLPTLLALGGNSPFWDGRDTGYASWRTMIWARWPSAGPPPYFTSVEQYEDAVRTMLESGVVLDRAMLYWDVRPSSHVPTLEIRVADVSATAEEAVLQAALVRALVATALRDLRAGRPAPPVREDLLRFARWRASREGLEGAAVDPLTGQVVPANELVDRLLDRVRPALADSGDLSLVTSLLADLRARGSGAARQRQAFARRGDLADVVRILVAQTAGREG